MLGPILQALADATTAEAMLFAVAKPSIRSRIERAAAAADVTVGALLSSELSHLLNHGGDDFWLDLLSAMADATDPESVAVERILTRAFPDPVRVRITRTPA